MSTASNLLIRLLDAAERAVTRRGDAIEAELLYDEVKVFADMPAPDGRFIGDYERVLADVLVKMERARGFGEHVTGWAQVAGVLIPLVRENLSRAIEARRVPLKSD